MAFIDKSYSDIIKNNPLLTKRQEINLSRQAKKGNHTARKKLIESNYRLVISIAKKYHRQNIDFDDLIQESSTGLLKAVDRFDPELGHKFSTYACWWIKQAALQFVNEQSGSIKVPTHSRMLYAKIRNRIKEMERQNGKKPSITQVAHDLGESVKKIKYTIKANSPTISYDNSDNEAAISIKDKIADESYFSNPHEALEKAELFSLIKKNLRLLSPKEEKIIRLRFGIEESESDIENFPVTEEMKEYLLNG